MAEFVHQRHKPVSPLVRPREIVVACVPLRSNVNVSAIARVASASAVQKLIICGNNKLIAKIARDGIEELEIETRRTLGPVLERLRADGYRLVGLEQAASSQRLPAYSFARRTALVIGNERLGITADVLGLLDDVVEIPVFGLPYSFNVASATSMALYEYCRQFPEG